MKPIRRTATCTVLFLALLGTVLAQQVKTDFDHQANFSQYKTYTWQTIKPANSLWEARIKSAIDAQLAAKGWTQVDSGGDVAIVAMATSHTERTLQTFYDGMGGGWRWRGFGGMGEATTMDTVSNNADKNEKNLDKGVAKMFKKFPPQSAKS
jgi:hypothetical protein